MVLADFVLPSEPGNERLAMRQVADAVAALGLPQQRLDRLKTAVAEATMNAIEHGNQNRAEVPVAIRVITNGGKLSVQITDQGGDSPIPEVQTPDLEAKLMGADRPRGWGLFLIKSLVDEIHTTRDGPRHTVELTVVLEAHPDAR